MIRALSSCILTALFALLLGCGGPDVNTNTAFWLRAPGDPALEFTPAWGLSAPGVTQKRVIKGVVRSHGAARVRDLDRLLVIERLNGDLVEMRYRIGGGRALPVAVGQPVRVLAFRRQRALDEGMDLGLLLFSGAVEQQTEAEAAPPEGEADEGAVEPAESKPAETPDLVAVVQMRAIVGEERIPATLRVLEPGDMDAYHESGSWETGCFEMRSHQHFALNRPEWLRDLKGGGPSARLLAPGSRLTLDDEKDRFDVILLDNRRTTKSSCTPLPQPNWSFAALRAPRPKAPTP